MKKFKELKRNQDKINRVNGVLSILSKEDNYNYDKLDVSIQLININDNYELDKMYDNLNNSYIKKLLDNL